MTDNISPVGRDFAIHLKAFIQQALFERLGSEADSPEEAGVEVTKWIEVFFDPFYALLPTCSLPLPDALRLLQSAIRLHPADDHIVVWVAGANWNDFYTRLLRASLNFPSFRSTIINIQQRFDVVETLPSDPHVELIPAGAGTVGLGWEMQFDQVYSAVLVLRFAAGAVPKELWP